MRNIPQSIRPGWRALALGLGIVLLLLSLLVNAAAQLLGDVARRAEG